MKTTIKKILKSILPFFIVKIYRSIRNAAVILYWEMKGKPVPPPKYLKHKLITNIQKNGGYKILVETGTYLGEMIEVQQDYFEKFFSIELSTELYNKAIKKFRKKKNVILYNGDSGKLMPEIIKNIDQPAIFWLDAHYCGGFSALGDKECPIYDEFDAILTSQYKHILLIDDARCFIGKKDYPTIQQLKDYFKGKGIKVEFENKDDVIRIRII